MPQKSHVCKLSLVALLPYANQYFHYILWLLLLGLQRWSSCPFAVFMNHMHLSDQFFFLKWPEADSKVDFESSANFCLKYTAKSHFFILRKIWNACWYILNLRPLPLLQWKIYSTLSCLWRLFWQLDFKTETENLSLLLVKGICICSFKGISLLSWLLPLGCFLF